MEDVKKRRQCKVPKRYIDEICEEKPKNLKKSKTKDNNLYEVEIMEVDKARNLVKIHFKGYSAKYDEWRPYDEKSLPVIRLERMSLPSEMSLSERLQNFHERLYREIKRKLYSRRRDDPEVRIEIPVDEDVFNEGIGGIYTSKMYYRNKVVHQVLSNELLDICIGIKWNERIMNETGDFAYVVPGTVRFWLAKRNPLVEFKLIGGKYIQSEIEEGYQVVFNFVRGDGNKRGYMNRDHH